MYIYHVSERKKQCGEGQNAKKKKKRIDHMGRAREGRRRGGRVKSGQTRRVMDAPGLTVPLKQGRGGGVNGSIDRSIARVTMTSLSLEQRC